MGISNAGPSGVSISQDWRYQALRHFSLCLLQLDHRSLSFFLKHSKIPSMTFHLHNRNRKQNEGKDICNGEIRTSDMEILIGSKAAAKEFARLSQMSLQHKPSLRLISPLMEVNEAVQQASSVTSTSLTSRIRVLAFLAHEYFHVTHYWASIYY